MDELKIAGQYLRESVVFVPGDWTPVYGNKDVHTVWKDEKNTLIARVRMTLKMLFSKRDNLDDIFFKDFSFLKLMWHRISSIPIYLFDHKDVPDAIIRNSILCTWGEDADYLNLVNPNVGLLLASVLESSTDESLLPLAQEIIKAYNANEHSWAEYYKKENKNDNGIIK